MVVVVDHKVISIFSFFEGLLVCIRANLGGAKEGNAQDSSPQTVRRYSRPAASKRGHYHHHADLADLAAPIPAPAPWASWADRLTLICRNRYSGSRPTLPPLYTLPFGPALPAAESNRATQAQPDSLAPFFAHVSV